MTRVPRARHSRTATAFAVGQEKEPIVSTLVHSLEPAVLEDAALELATADDIATGLAHVVEEIAHHSGARRVEWWAPGDDGAPQLVAATGKSRGRCRSIPFGAAGTLVL